MKKKTKKQKEEQKELEFRYKLVRLKLKDLKDNLDAFENFIEKLKEIYK